MSIVIFGDAKLNLVFYFKVYEHYGDNRLKQKSSLNQNSEK